ncbi:hypothetical protein QOZ80_4AG0305980 [Eleusine coracana subsp. coracana]|nr:hypothetical protein QOZ80_4AG0305980 [Eleusine coracana subsp. coracana]
MGMSCARHPYKDGVGVCAPCLRDRLLALAAAQNEASSLPPPPPPQPLPEPELVFPRSVSPYVCRRKSDAASAPRAGRPPGLLFFRTPQVGPACGGGAELEEGDIGFRRRRSGRFSVLAALFGGGGRSEEKEKEKGGGGKPPKHHHRSWLAGIMPRGRGKKKEEELDINIPQRCSCSAFSDRGLSPVRYAGEDSAFPPESPWLPSPSPLRKSPCRRLLSSAGAGVSGFAVCISPLVRPRHHGGPTPDAAAAAAVPSQLPRPSPLHGLASGSLLPHCRSWKLADGGRFR